MATTFNSGVYPEEYVAKIQERLQRPTNWKEVCRVEYTDKQIINNPYAATHPTVTSGTRGTAYSFGNFELTNDTITINDYQEVSNYIDRADLAQASFGLLMELADRQGQLMNEKIESKMLSGHSAWTNLGDSAGNVVLNATATITVSASNIDDIIRAVKREIRVANGSSQMAQNGVFIIWRPADFELLEAFVQANGFSTADTALKDGTQPGFRYLGVDHYVSNDHTANHLFAGVKKLYHLGICRSTYGQVSFIQNPAGASGGVLSGTGIHTRADFQFKAWNTVTGLLFDINVA